MSSIRGVHNRLSYRVRLLAEAICTMGLLEHLLGLNRGLMCRGPISIFLSGKALNLFLNLTLDKVIIGLLDVVILLQHLHLHRC